MTARKMKVTEEMLGPFDIRAPRNLEDADRAWKELFKVNPPACRVDIAPAGWSRVRYYAGKVFMVKGQTI